MCGIIGYYSDKYCDYDTNHEVIKKMSDKLKHRGPDASGYWIDEKINLVFGHRRLKIIDLTDAGHQPMLSNSKRFIISFNGEIYNHKSLREELIKDRHASSINSIVNEQKWNGHSDTETILNAVELWGLEKTLEKINGMFAFALWDRKERNLYLARDRMGEKPLYYGWQDGTFLFSSELKSIREHPSFKNEIDLESLTAFLKYNYVPTPLSIYKNIKKLSAGSYLKLNLDQGHHHKSHNIIKYWSLNDNLILNNDDYINDGNVLSSFEDLLLSTISDQMIADVPVGAFLSGGIDSSIIVCLMQRLSTKPVNTFTVGFHESNYNEAEYAKKIAKYLKTDHNELYVTPSDALNIIPKLPQIYDEPFSDSSQIPTILISEFAKQSVSVALSGDGGDELFGGYNRYIWGHKINKYFRHIPLKYRKYLKDILQSVSPTTIDYLFKQLNFIGNRKIPQMGNKLHKFGNLLDFNNEYDLYDKIISLWDNKSDVVKNYKINRINNYSFNNKLNTIQEKMMFTDMLTYLPDDILVKLDRAAMSKSLETRIPLLNHRVVEFSLKLPLHYKMRSNVTKWILRETLSKYLPQDYYNRPKMGFGVPIDSWLKGSLNEWANSLINEKKIKEQGFFNHNVIQKKWDEHICGSRNWHHHLWSVLMFQAWYESA